MKKSVITETQQMDSLWSLIIVATTLGLNWVLYFIMHERDMTVFYVSITTAALIAGLLSFTRLDVRWDGESFNVKLRPYMFSPLEIKKEDISSISLRTYKPVREFGGWGLRYSKRFGKAYTIKGNSGLQIELKSGKKILIGTSHPEMWRPLTT